MNPFDRSMVRGAADDFRRTWPQLVLTDLVARAVAVVVIAPLLGLLLKLFLWRTSDGVVTDEQIAEVQKEVNARWEVLQQRVERTQPQPA